MYIAKTKQKIKAFVDGLCAILHNVYIFFGHAHYTVIINEYYED